jgi:hypothetical protein
MSSAIQALERATASRQKAGDIEIPAIARANLNAYLANRQANGWTAQDRQDYLAACKFEFEAPTAAGGVEAAVAFWAMKAGEFREAA